MAAVSALTVVAGLVPIGEDLGVLGARAYAAPVGQGFNLNPSDLRFILDQVKIAEHHAANFNPQDPCAGLVGPGPHQIPVGGNSVELPWGLRTVDGSCNNLLPGQSTYGAADQAFPRRVPGSFAAAEANPRTGAPTSYQNAGDVYDSQPRTISNLVVDQTAKNPAAVAAAGPDAKPDPATGTLPIPNVAPDAGLSAPYNSVFTFFGQFFDHGLDLVAKGGNGNVYMPLRPDDPLYKPGSPTNFMVVSRATLLPGTRESKNLTTPFVDQNQTYSSHPSHQVFLREYALDAAGRPVSTGRLLEGSAGGQATWLDLKDQARELLGIQLTDTDVLNVPLLATDPYGNFIPGPNGFPKIVTATGEVEGDPTVDNDGDGVADGVALPANTVRTGHAFLDDIAHHAVPTGDRNPMDGPGPVEPLDPDTDPGVTDDHQAATYDDEMLGAHFVAGDGRVNENIGLTSIHHIFHSEHNRLAGAATVPGSIKNVLVTEDAASVSEWQLPDGSWNGERIFQAAKFVTEMEYQHLVFEEFARKVQPMVNAFGEGGVGYDTSVNPAIKAEFAHAVYRFGHSMLTETVARTNADGSRNNVPLMDAFLNPQEFTDGGPAGQLTADEAAGSVFRGMSRQRGNEIDEFVTAALRSNLLGLPLDLAAINMARARETGTPTLNEARRQFFAESNNTALRPYESWVDLSNSLRHRESLVNFVAAYGTHPSLAGPDRVVGTLDDTARTVQAKRDAAQRLVDGDASNPLTPADAVDFMNGTGAWSGTETGLNDVDLWVGGLAEKPMLFGGLLGPTFNYVFELQLESLQFGDRFYYLSRTAGLNLLTQLEGNSFAELVMRNTDVEGLPADAFSRPDLVFDVGRLGATGPVLDDPTTEEYDESRLLTRNQANGTLLFTGPEHTVWNGTAGADRLYSSEGDDTIRGNDGADWMQGGDGADNLIGGLDDDIMNDLFGDDTLKGGDGNDALSSGQGLGGDLNQGGRGKDFIVDGNDITETFGGPGNDFVLGGDDSDTVFGDDGDDWIEGGKGPFNLLQGDNGAPFQNDPNAPGNDVIDGDGGEQDFDSEGGDDIMLMGPGIQRAEGMAGFDWSTHQGDPRPGDSDMLFTGLMPPSVAALRDRFDLVEGLSGWKLDDTLRGDGVTVPAAGGTTDPADPGAPEAPAPEPGVNPEEQVLTQAGIDRIDGLADVLPAGTTSFSAGNIILGGGGDDVIEGRGEDDVIDGDRWLNVALRVPDLSTPAAGDTRLVDGLAALSSDVFAGRLDPGDFTIVRRVLTAPAAGSADDSAVYSDARVNYDCSVDGGPFQIGGCPVNVPAGATVVIRHAAGTQADGTDTLTNIEHLVFSDTTPPAVPTAVEASPHNASATVKWTPGRGTVTDWWVRVLNSAGQQVGPERHAAAGATELRVDGLVNGQTYTFQVRAENAAGSSDWSLASSPVTPADTEAAAPTIGLAVAGDGQVTVHWTAPVDDGGSAITSYQVRVTNAANQRVGALREAPGTATELTVTGLTNGTRYWFEVFAVNAVGRSPASRQSTTTPGTVPGPARVGTASARDSAAVVRWLAPREDGGLDVTGYRVRVLDDAGAQVRVRSASVVATRLRVGGLTNGETYRFQVAAVNEMGVGRFSQPSNPVVPGTRPAAPVIRRPERGASGGPRTATARWSESGTPSVPAVTGYRVTALQVASDRPGAKVLRRFRSPLLGPGRRDFRFVLPEGTYRFEVRAFNVLGRSAPSERSRAVRAR